MHKAHINTWHIVYISYLPATEHTHRACLATQSSAATLSTAYIGSCPL